MVPCFLVCVFFLQDSFGTEHYSREVFTLVNNDLGHYNEANKLLGQREEEEEEARWLSSVDRHFAYTTTE